MNEAFDVVVIGGGTAGLVTASGCARLGRKVALIEKHALGGDCLWTGCVPTKALVATAKLTHKMQNAHLYGLEPVHQTLDPRRIMDSMRESRHVISHHDDPERFRGLGIDVIIGEARITAPGRVTVGARTLDARDIVIATGSRTSVPPIPGLAETGFLDHATFLDQDTFPSSIAILGGGSIGIEFAQIFRRFGSEVVVVEMLDEIIFREDPDVITTIRSTLEAEGIVIRTGWTVKKASRDGDQKVLEIESKDGKKDRVTAAGIFVASGRRGNTENLGLEALGVKLNRSYVAVDARLRTSVPRVWACGDVHGGLQFTHVAAAEAVKLVRNMLFPGTSAVSYDNVPWGLYTDPEVGHIGMTEPEAVAEHGKDRVRVYKVPMDDVDRAIIDRTTEGFVKIVTDTKGSILGAHIVSANASSLIEEIVLARKKKIKIGELAQLISPYPSLADSIQKAAALYYQDLGSGWLGRLGKRIAAWSQ